MWRGMRGCMGKMASVLVLGGLLVSTETGGAAAAEDATNPNSGKVSLSLGADFPTAYYFRGILKENQDLIFQPFADVTFTLYEGTNGLDSLSLTTGSWNSFHWGPTGAEGPNQDPTEWYESDFFAGLNLGLFDNWELGTTYTAYMSPNGSFFSVEEIAVNVGYDDSKLLGAFALSPRILFAFEFDGQADGGAQEGTYLELGIEPGFTPIESERFPVNLSFPLTLGLSLDDYYESATGRDDTFGYFDGGIVASLPLAFIPAAYGSWEVSAGLHLLLLGDNLKTVNNGDDFEAIGIFGIGMTY